MKWAGIRHGGRDGLSITYGGRKYALSRFEGGCWAVYRGREVYVSGFCTDDRGTYALLRHPADDHLGKVVPRSELAEL